MVAVTARCMHAGSSPVQCVLLGAQQRLGHLCIADMGSSRPAWLAGTAASAGRHAAAPPGRCCACRTLPLAGAGHGAPTASAPPDSPAGSSTRCAAHSAGHVGMLHSMPGLVEHCALHTSLPLGESAGMPCTLSAAASCMMRQARQTCHSSAPVPTCCSLRRRSSWVRAFSRASWYSLCPALSELPGGARLASDLLTQARVSSLKSSGHGRQPRELSRWSVSRGQCVAYGSAHTLSC